MKPNLIKIGQDDISSLFIKRIDEHHYNSPFHFHNLCELNYVIESHGKRMVGDNINNFSAGDLVLMSPNLPHIWYNDPSILANPSDTRIAKAIVVYFPYDFLTKLTGEDMIALKIEKLLEQAKRGLRFYGETQQQVMSRLDTIMDKNALSRTISFLEIMNILIDSKEFEPLASVGFTHNLNEKDTERMNKVIKYIMQNFANPISLDEVSEIANMTPPAFSSFFKKRTQKNFSSFLNEIRIGHACKLLQDPEISISEVCYLSGFQNFTNFNKFFKHFTGKVPREYRKDCMDLDS